MVNLGRKTALRKRLVSLLICVLLGTGVMPVSDESAAQGAVDGRIWEDIRVERFSIAAGTELSLDSDVRVHSVGPVEIHGLLRGLSGVDVQITSESFILVSGAIITQDVLWVATEGPHVLAGDRSASGIDAGDITLAAPLIQITNEGILKTGDGGRGLSAVQRGASSGPDWTAAHVTARGGNGGNGGDVTLDAPVTSLEGRVFLGGGGDGGDAVALRGPTGPPSASFDARGGDGGHAGVIIADNAAALSLASISYSSGGRGGDGYAGAIDDICANDVGSHGADGTYSGGGDGWGENGEGADARGTDGDSAEPPAGPGESGQCASAAGGNGGNGAHGTSSAPYGGYGGTAGLTQATGGSGGDGCPAGSGGSASANGGDGGRGGDSYLVQPWGNGGNGGYGAWTHAYGGHGGVSNNLFIGICNGGDGGNASAIGGDGGRGGDSCNTPGQGGLGRPADPRPGDGGEGNNLGADGNDGVVGFKQHGIDGGWGITLPC